MTDSTPTPSAVTPEEVARSVVDDTAATASLSDKERRALTARVADALAAAERRGAAEEREACAQVAQDAWALMASFGMQQTAHYEAACIAAAKAIRARRPPERMSR
jgi:hypothetical protein